MRELLQALQSLANKQGAILQLIEEPVEAWTYDTEPCHSFLATVGDRTYWAPAPLLDEDEAPDVFLIQNMATQLHLEEALLDS